MIDDGLFTEWEDKIMLYCRSISYSGSVRRSRINPLKDSLEDKKSHPR